ncbi:MAG: DEAD/DEAH box helicase [Gemmatimonadota bacterium]|nr:MAG: DEAD/DEAH box helicase [Gemmatimonadota bacterium]
MHEPLLWKVQLGSRSDPTQVVPTLRAAVLGPMDHDWHPPEWLKSHQIDAVRRVRSSLAAFRCSILADAVGLGKTYMALAVAAGYGSVAVVVPAALKSQWQRVSKELGVHVSVQTHDMLSRGKNVSAADLIVVDEAHRVRNPATRRYAVLARSVRQSQLLLLTATPVVNRASDLVNLLRLALADNAFALLGLPSLEQSLARRDYGRIVQSTAPIIIARSPHTIPSLQTALPRLHDAPILRPPTAEPQVLTELLRIVDQLEFPSMANDANSSLLKLHLLYRLASSTDACRDTARRHLAYADRAIAAAERGELLSRRTASQIFSSEHDLQLDLHDLERPASPIQTDKLTADRARLRCLLRRLSGINGPSPKAATLARLLAERPAQKTIVFTAAVSTALHLAAVMRWHHVAVVGSGRAWIASGRIPVEEALSLFAPIARRARDPAPSSRVLTLVATDLVSEGLDLQDADAVVHYDLPWTPLRLAQRIGRIARLGSIHNAADVWWFALPYALERRLELQARIAQKVEHQLSLRVAATSGVGRARIVNQQLEQRELLGGTGCARRVTEPRHTVVQGPLAAAIAVRWHWGAVSIPELLVIAGRPLRQVTDYAEMSASIRLLSAAARSHQRPPDDLVGFLLSVIRQRFAASEGGPVNQTALQLTRRLMRHARTAGRNRDVESLDLLDAVLERLKEGVNIGCERDLGQLLSLGAPIEGLREWVALRSLPPVRPPEFEIDAAMFGDGSIC